jgi:hypothetical protein
VIVIVGSAFNRTARDIAARWGSQRAALLTAEDVCSPGWSLRVPADDAGRAVVGGRVISNGEIEGVLTLRPRVFAAELRLIRPADRQYVSVEMNAFLLAWLTSLRCRVMNRPCATSLAGPTWSAEQWTTTAAALGIPVRRRTRVVPAVATSPAEDAIEVVAIGEQCFGAAAPALADWTRRLARAAAVELMAARFSRTDHHLLSATSWPPLGDGDVFDALRARMEDAA